MILKYKNTIIKQIVEVIAFLRRNAFSTNLFGKFKRQFFFTIRNTIFPILNPN